jgi:hypothetical protein
MDQMKRIHLDELPEPCRRDIRRFFQKPHWDAESDPGGCPELYRNPEDYIILASRTGAGSQANGWQASFLHKSDIETFQSYHPDFRTAYLRVTGVNGRLRCRTAPVWKPGSAEARAHEGGNR